MKVALVLENADPHRGGAEGWTFDFARQLAARGHEVHLLAQRFAAAAEAEPIIAHQLPRSRSRVQFAEEAERALRQLQADVVHDMGAGWHGQIFQSHDGSRFALWDRKLQALPRWAQPWKRALLRCSPRYRDFARVIRRQFASDWLFLAVSHAVAEDYIAYHGVDPRRIRVIHHGVDARRFSPEACEPLREPTRAALHAAADDVLWLFVGHDFARKGLAAAIRALARVHAGDGLAADEALPGRGEEPSLATPGRRARLIVVGGRRGAAQYAALARRLGVGHAVAFVGAQADPLAYYAAADALVLPTLHEPFGLVVLEAAACGLPVVVSRRAGASELFEHGRNALLLDDPRDDRTLARRMHALLDPWRRQRMGAAARKLAMAHSAEANCEQILALYGQIAGRRAAA